MIGEAETMSCQKFSLIDIESAIRPQIFTNSIKDVTQ